MILSPPSFSSLVVVPHSYPVSLLAMFWLFFYTTPPPPVQWSTGRHLADPCQYEAPLVAKWFVLSLLLKGAVKGLRGC